MKTFNIINKEWSFNNEKRYKWIYNLLKKDYPNFNYDIEDFLIKINKSKLIQFIKKLDLGDSSKEALYFTVSKYLQLNDPTNKNIIKFQTEGHKLLKKTRDKDAENEIDKDKVEAYQDYNYFLEILKSKDYLKITDIKDHLEYLLLSLVVLNPPLRTNFYSTAILNKAGKTEDNKNYIWLKEYCFIQGKKRAYIIVNKDKVSNTKQFKDDIIKNNIEIENKELINLLWFSFEKFPRAYLFEVNNKKLSDDILRRYLRNITKISNINFDIMRSIYITHSYKTTARTVKNREDLSVKMRHSPAIAARAYFKIKDDEPKEENETIKELRAENEKLKIELNKLKEELNKTKPAETDKLFIKRKADILYRLNNKKATAKPDTMAKYKIIFDNEKKKYI